MDTYVSQLTRGALVSVIVMATSSGAWGLDKTGREVVETVCTACHAEGKDGAPRIGDLAAWTQRAQGGFVKLSEHAIAGKNKMPAHGGQSTLSDLELTRAIAYMATGGRAADPSKPFSQTKTIESDILVSTHCAKCHEAGLNGAPRLHDFADWKPRVGKGIDELLHSTVVGHNQMPSRAGLPSLSDTDLRNAITYMIVQSVSRKQNPAK